MGCLHAGTHHRESQGCPWGHQISLLLFRLQELVKSIPAKDNSLLLPKVDVNSFLSLEPQPCYGGQMDKGVGLNLREGTDSLLESAVAVDVWGSCWHGQLLA